MNILGQPFSPWVTKQIILRQQSLGYVNYDNNDLLYQNNKTPWIRLASSVNIEASTDSTKPGVLEKFNKIGVPRNAMEGRNAARNFILQGGSVGLDDENNLITYSGINTSSQFYKGAYGWGETTERGFVALPGIIDASLIYYNNGALSKGVINMKCFSRNQLALMDALYMRPGYNLLLEFGWTSWLNNDTNEIDTFNTFASPALGYILGANAQGTDENPSNFEIPRLIQSERKKTYGNYEGVFGKITNFNWSFEADGSYSCQTTITGMGGVIEGLKINGATYSKAQRETLEELQESAAEIPFVGDAVSDEVDDALNALRLKSELDNILDHYYGTFVDRLSNRSSKIDYGFLAASFKNFTDPKDNFKAKKLIIKNAICGFDGIDTDSEENLTPACFMSFGMFIAIIQSNFLIYNGKEKPYFSFDMDFFNLEKDHNYILNIPGQFSANPQVCFTPYNNVPEVKTKEGVNLTDNINLPNTNLQVIFSRTKKNFIVDKGISEYLGRLAHVYINFQFIKKCLADAPRNDEDNSLALLPFLKTVLAGICKARGGINSIAVHEDINTNTIKFIEEVPQNWAKAIPPESETDAYCRINTYGVKNKVEGSIVRSIDMKASISKEFAAMITIGAQSNGNQLNENSTSFSKYNRGLIDRTFVNKVTDKKSKKASTVTEENKKEKETLQTLWNKKMNKKTKNSKGLFYGILSKLKWVTKNIVALESSNISYIKMLQGILTQEDVNLSPFFLPFNLSLDIDGISGIKLYQKFTIDDSVLPPSYDKDSVDLQIKGANHTVNATDWITKIETQSVPRSGEIKIAQVKQTVAEEVKEVVAQTSTTQVQPDQVTITSQYPLEDIFYPIETPKTQIYLHHTAGNQNIKRTIEIWNQGTTHVSTHYITNNSGEVEQLYIDEYWANHLGVKGITFTSLKIPYRNLNKYSLGIELSAFGGVTLKGGVYKTIYNSTLPESSVAQPINAFGKPMTYKGYAYYEKYSNAQIANVKNVVTGWMNKYSIPFNYDWNELFNPNTLSTKALKGEKGVYTHNSVRTGKQDIFPQKELIDMLKSIATNINEPAKSNSIVWEILQSDVRTSANGSDTNYNVKVKLKGTLNGESISFFEENNYSQGGNTPNSQAALNLQILYCKEEIVDEGYIRDNNDWVNAQNSVPI